MKFYVASSISDVVRVRVVQAALLGAGHTLTYDWTTHSDVTSDADRSRTVAVREIHAVISSALVVMIFPGGKGTHIELGAALATGRRVFAITDGSADLLTRSAFYRHPLITWIDFGPQHHVDAQWLSGKMITRLLAEIQAWSNGESNV